MATADGSGRNPVIDGECPDSWHGGRGSLWKLTGAGWASVPALLRPREFECGRGRYVRRYAFEPPARSLANKAVRLSEV